MPGLEVQWLLQCEDDCHVPMLLPERLRPQ